MRDAFWADVTTFVIAGFDPAIALSVAPPCAASEMAGTSPAMTIQRRRRLALHQLGACRLLAGLRLGEVLLGLALGGEHFVALALVLLGLERCFVARAG